jgi:hypothetical protein
VRGVGVDALVQREVRRRVVECLVQSRVGRGVRTCEARYVLIQVAFSLRSGDGGARAVVVVEGEVVVVFVVEEVALREPLLAEYKGGDLFWGRHTSLNRSQNAEYPSATVS